MSMGDVTEKAKDELEKVSEKKWLIGIGKLCGAIAAAILTYYQGAAFVEKKTERLDNKAEAGQSEVAESLQKIQSERKAEREALVKELATLRAQIETLSRRQRKATLKPIATPAPAPISTVKVTPAEVQQQAAQVQQALPPAPKPPQLSPNLDVALQKQEQKAGQQQQQPQK